MVRLLLSFRSRFEIWNNGIKEITLNNDYHIY